jgi:hypothetical protein
MLHHLIVLTRLPLPQESDAGAQDQGQRQDRTGSAPALSDSLSRVPDIVPSFAELHGSSGMLPNPSRVQAVPSRTGALSSPLSSSFSLPFSSTELEGLPLYGSFIENQFPTNMDEDMEELGFLGLGSGGNFEFPIDGGQTQQAVAAQNGQNWGTGSIGYTSVTGSANFWDTYATQVGVQGATDPKRMQTFGGKSLYFQRLFTDDNTHKF